jgi:hypothetical protein
VSDPTHGPSYGSEGEQPANPYGPPPTPPNPYAAPEPGVGGPPPTTPPTYEQAPYGQAPYGQEPYGQPSYPQPGYPPAPGYPGAPYGYAAPPPNDGGATAAMIVGIVSLVLACGYGIGLLGAPVALVMGRRSMKRIDASQGTLGGRGMALAGFVMGIIGTIFLVLAIILGVVLAIAFATGGFDSGSSFDGTDL